MSCHASCSTAPAQQPHMKGQKGFKPWQIEASSQHESHAAQTFKLSATLAQVVPKHCRLCASFAVNNCCPGSCQQKSHAHASVSNQHVHMEEQEADEEPKRQRKQNTPKKAGKLQAHTGGRKMQCGKWKLYRCQLLTGPTQALYTGSHQLLTWLWGPHLLQLPEVCTPNPHAHHLHLVLGQCTCRPTASPTPDPSKAKCKNFIASTF